MDLTGITGFFSQRKVINGDGLINSFEYLDYVRNGNLEQYLKDKKIYFYSTHTEKVDSIQNEFTDLIYSGNFGGYPFKFPVSDLIFSMPFTYNHVINKKSGEWYLFKIKKFE
ncbi:MAG: hypothetical protein ABIO41_02395 [Ignavibacteria bacterium]